MSDGKVRDAVDKEQEYMKQIATHLAEFFAKEPEKITYWLFSKNLNLGNIRPAQLILSGRIHKLAQWMEDTKEGNVP